MRKLIITLLVLTLASCGNSTAAQQPAAGSSPATPSGIAATPISSLADTLATPITAQTEPAATAMPGLGLSRTKLEFLFRNSASVVSFADDPSVADGQAALGTSEAKGITVHLLGNPNNIQEVAVNADFDQGADSGELMLHLLTLMKGLAPTIKNPSTWLRQHITQAQKQSPDITIEGRYMITITASQKPPIIRVSVRPAHM